MKKNNTHPSSLPVIGWREWVGLPQFKVKRIKVKVDSGAKTSSLHVSHIKQKKGSKKILFKIHPVQDHHLPELEVESKVVEHRYVKSSNGTGSLRPVVKTMIKMGDIEFPIELTLVNRDLMGFRMLIGREALRNRYLIHSGKSFLLESSRPKKKKVRKTI